MKLWCIFALLIAAVFLTAIPVSPQWSRTSGLELKVDTAEAITYRRARVTSRRVARRDYRYTRRAVRRGAMSERQRARIAVGVLATEAEVRRGWPQTGMRSSWDRPALEGSHAPPRELKLIVVGSGLPPTQALTKG
jgi:hypothetical protein